MTQQLRATRRETSERVVMGALARAAARAPPLQTFSLDRLILSNRGGHQFISKALVFAVSPLVSITLDSSSTSSQLNTHFHKYMNDTYFYKKYDFHGTRLEVFFFLSLSLGSRPETSSGIIAFTVMRSGRGDIKTIHTA